MSSLAFRLIERVGLRQQSTAKTKANRPAPRQTERGSAMWKALSKRLSMAAAVASTAALAVVALAAGAHAAAETPPFNLEVILRDIGDGKGFGHVTFRQRNDDSKVVLLDTWVRDLAPNHSYRLQRAVDQTLDGNCTSTAWLTLGRGLEARDIATDDRGTGRADLFRSVACITHRLAVRHPFPGDRRDDLGARAPKRLLPLHSQGPLNTARGCAARATRDARPDARRQHAYLRLSLRPSAASVMSCPSRLVCPGYGRSWEQQHPPGARASRVSTRAA